MKASEQVDSVMCWHCEEPVHPYASRCPYCNKALSSTTSTTQKKIEPIYSLGVGDPVFEAKTHAETVITEAEDEKEQVEGFAAQVGHVLLSLFTLLAGSFFFFFGLLILLFSQKGVFTLEWKATTWPYFVLSALVLLSTGLWSLSKVEK